ncbi:iron-chelator utilization protein [Buttiauxella ferragutiae ATCC 51602]|uniref:Iron-chelator utilization protein n=1 Tax=Buttiauxella ferragutiae ATCC 51602 TaxID=1354252 RepID=A0ABX2W430_9ENTR|nr:siderophore-interacting protein [Buttiauxella ferragutiae]OAT25222.1 iron-chelator utilization protein [Buttiauxella ferragutiae ATCC 51602]
MAGVQGYRLFNVQLVHKSQVSPSLLSLVFGGPDIANMKCDAPDQRIKMLFPSEDGSFPTLPEQAQWYQLLQELPKEKRPIVRTYTLRHVDAARQEVTVEFVSHGTEGPASAWAIAAEAGDKIQIVAPNAAYSGDSGGYEWTPPEGLRQALIIADETALPAARGILELLATQPNPPQIQAFFEVPEQGDCVDLSAYSFASIHWLPRKTSNARHGECLLKAVRADAQLPKTAGVAETVNEEAEGELLWDKATTASNTFYGWVAAESTVVKMLRRYLIGECGVNHDAINFMAYWSKGRQR